MKRTTSLILMALIAIVVALLWPAARIPIGGLLSLGVLGTVFQQENSDYARQLRSWGFMDAFSNLRSMIGNSGIFGNVCITIDRQFSIAGIGNGADITDDAIFTTVLPKNTLAKNGDELLIEANLSSAANGNNKTAKIILGATTLLTTGVITSNAKKIWLELRITRTAAGTQLWDACVSIDGTAGAVTHGTGAEDLTAQLNLKLTLASPTTGAASDLLATRWAVDFASLSA